MKRGSVATATGTLAALTLLAGSTALPGAVQPDRPTAAARPGLLRLVRPTPSAGLRAAATASVGPRGASPDGWRTGVDLT
ncbi:hypothetical protein JNW88_27650, partial [Micromonospora sp. ATA32]|nr:hypothetical protein [Micromonospora sp. ATA32]